jgi:hypothetical protein
MVVVDWRQPRKVDRVKAMQASIKRVAVERCLASAFAFLRPDKCEAVVSKAISFTQAISLSTLCIVAIVLGTYTTIWPLKHDILTRPLSVPKLLSVAQVKVLGNGVSLLTTASHLSRRSEAKAEARQRPTATPSQLVPSLTRY